MRRAVLVIDGTGKGHAICRLFARSGSDITVYYGPGCSAVSEPQIVSVPEIRVDRASDVDTVLTFLDTHPVDFVFVSDLYALRVGFVDSLRAAGVRVIGPSQEASRLETSKIRGREFCIDNGIPTPWSRVFSDPVKAIDFVASLPTPPVVKMNGVCVASDGVYLPASLPETVEAINEASTRMGADFQVVIEECLVGTELSLFAMLGSSGYALLPAARDYKRSRDGDTGKNCSGMGSIAPHTLSTPDLDDRVRKTILDPFMRGVSAAGIDYTGFLYLGAFIAPDGQIRVIEVNTRFGDSEAQSILPGVVDDFFNVCADLLVGETPSLRFDGLHRCCVSLTQGPIGDPADPDVLPGWPDGPFERSIPVLGVDQVDPQRAEVFFAEIARSDDGTLVSDGGRVLHIVGYADTMARAVDNAYSEAAKIRFRGLRYRNDIGRI